MRGGGGGEGGLGTNKSSPELVLSVSIAAEEDRGGDIRERVSFIWSNSALEKTVWYQMGMFPHESGFRKGQSTMDSVLCLESDLMKAETNKEVVIAVFFDVQKHMICAGIKGYLLS